MDRLFLDANILFSAAYRPNAGLLRLWQLKNVSLCSSHYALEEARFNLADENQDRSLARLTQSLQLFTPSSREFPPGASLPEKDRPILLAAMEARATHLITGDIRHFGRYFGKTIEGILVLTPAEYLKSYRR
jgi:predicted nucleic acid-binding protein